MQALLHVRKLPRLVPSDKSGGYQLGTGDLAALLPGHSFKMAALLNKLFGSRGAQASDEAGAPKNMHVKEVNIYPIKSCKGMRATTVACESTGKIITYLLVACLLARRLRMVCDGRFADQLPAGICTGHLNR